MTRHRLTAAFVVLVFGLAFWPRAASAASVGQFELKLNYWPATSSWSFNNPNNGSWNSQFWGGDLRWTSNSGWGIHLKYDTGAESSWSGYFGAIGANSGQDTIWSGDVFYAWQLARATLRGFAGYGHMVPVDQRGFQRPGCIVVGQRDRDGLRRELPVHVAYGVAPRGRLSVDQLE